MISKPLQMLVLGAGSQGRACAYDLLETTEAGVTIADRDLPDLPPYLEPHRDRLEMLPLDVGDMEAVEGVFAAHNAVMSAVPYYYNFELARAAVEAGTHFTDLGGNTEIVRQQLTLEERAKAQGVTVVADTGLAPGMVNILARAGIDRLDRVESVKLFVGGLPQHPVPPLNYQIVYSLEGALDYYTTPSWILRGGTPTEIEPLTEVEDVTFPNSVGKLEAFHTAGGLSLMPWDFAGRVPTMEYKTLRYPGHAELMRAIRDLGLLDLDPVVIDGTTSVRPRDVFVATVDPRLRNPEGNDLVALDVEVTGVREGEPTRVRYRLLDYYDAETGISAMMRTTGFTLSLTGQMQVAGRCGEPGVRTAYQAIPAEPYIEALAERGIVVEIDES